MAHIFQWSPALSVKVDKIDEQHQELIDQINGFLQAVLNGEGTEKLGGTIDFLLAYVDLHFRTEEYFMEKYKYPLYERHRSEHERLTGEVIRVAQEITETDLTRDVVTELVTQMGTWVVEHVQKMDKTMGRYLESLGGRLDTRLPDHLSVAALRVQPSESSEVETGICDHFETCSKLFDNLLDSEHSQFWIDRFCRKPQGRQECRRKQEIDRGVQPEEVSRTMLPDGYHLPHLAG